MKTIIIAALLMSLAACATQGDPCDDPNLHCEWQAPALPAHADHAVKAPDGTVQLKGQ